MTDCFLITVPSQEKEEFLHTYGDFHFLRLGMICNVISCHIITFFSTNAKYMEHFMKTHMSHVHIYKCILCGRMFQKKNKRAHLNAHGNVRSKFNPNYLALWDYPVALPSRQKPSNINENELRSYKHVSVANKREEYKTYMSRRQSSAQILEEFENQA